MADTAARDKSVTYDEIAHLTGGYSYWHTGDYRLYPENGMLPQWWAGLPVHLRGAAFPGRDDPAWVEGNHWRIGDRFFHELGNDPGAMLRAGRRMIVVVAVALGLLVYAWSRRLSGPAGGMVSLVLWVFSPTVLAHGALVTSDMTASLTMTAALAAIWHALQRPSGGAVLLAAVVSGLLFVSKVSAFVILPVLPVLVAIRLVAGARGRIAPLGVVVAGAVVGTAVVSAVIWAFHGFRFASSATDPVAFDWAAVLPGTGAFGPYIDAARAWRLLPERFLFGVAHVLDVTRGQPAFLRGEFRLTGWWYYYPYAFLAKTPVGTLAVLASALAAAAAGWRRAPAARRRAVLYQASPLLVFLAVYWTFTVTSAYDLGERHLLPTYAPTFILGGAAAYWLGARRRPVRLLVPLLLLGVVLESWSVRPHYLAFFNVLAGGPSAGYRQLVDSSLDWGQDLPGLARWLAEDRARGGSGPVYLSYFGTGRPESYGIAARRLPGAGSDGYRVEDRFPWTGGTYCVSATALSNIYNKLAAIRGPWRREYEDVLRRKLWRKATRFDRAAGDPEAQRRLIAKRGEAFWRDLLWTFDMLRQARLTAYLRGREPDAEVGHSILIYRLSAEEVRAALEGPVATDEPVLAVTEPGS
jgi:hypothetical protein